jgi:hypothetical protein
MKLWIAYIGIFALGLMSFVIVIKNSPSPESLILGQWSELAWEYEKVDKSLLDSTKYKTIAEDVKATIGQNLVIHEAETWHFLPNRKLKLISENSEKTVSWLIKGRGHILQLKYDNNSIETYNLTELSDDTLVLNFESDIQARGIAKLTFTKSRI